MQHSVGSIPTSHVSVLSFAEAADYLGLSQAALIRVLERGELEQLPESTGTEPRFHVDDLEQFLEVQRDRAALTGKLTMPLQISIDVPALLSAMVRMRDEREAAESLATDLRAFTGSRCPAVAILRVDEVAQTVRLLGLSDFPGRESLPSAVIANAVEADVTLLQGPLRVAVVEARSVEVRNVEEILEPVMGDAASELADLLNLHGAIVNPLLRIGSVRWIIALLLEGDPLEIRPEKRDAVEALGIQASIALEAVRLRVDVLQRANRAEALYSTVRMLARSEDSSSLLERISAQAARLLSADAAAVLIYDESREEFHPGAQTGLAVGAAQWTANLSSAYLVGRAAGMTRPLQITDASQTTTLTMPQLAGKHRALAALCAPIVHRGALLGAIEVYSARPRSFSEDDMALLSAFAHQAAIAIHSVRTQENRRRALLGAVEALASANEARDGYTGEHCKRLAQLAVLVARRLGFSEEEVERIGLASALHDIGKIAVPDAILRKPGKLTDDERAIINQHPTTGEEIVMRVPELHDVAIMVGAHQERYDGRGYPRGLAGEAIPMGARIIACVDTYAALIEDRPYRKGATHEQALAEMQRCAGSQLDPTVVQAFVDMGDQIKQVVKDTDELLATQGAIEMANIERGLPSIFSSPQVGQIVPPASVLPGAHPQMHRATELAAMSDIIRTIATARDLRKMYEAVHRKLGDLIDLDAMLILLSDGTPAGQRHLPELLRAPFFQPLGNPVEDGINAPVARLKRPLWVSDYLQFASERGLGIDLDAARARPRSIIAVPIIVDDEFIGLLSVQALHPEAYDKRHVGLVEEIALHLGLVLRNSREYAVLTGREDRLGAGRRGTTRLTGRLAAVGSPEELAQLLANELSQVVAHDDCEIYLIELGEPTLAAVGGFTVEEARRAAASLKHPRGTGFVWAVIEQGTTLNIDALLQDERAMTLVRPPLPAESALLLPLLHNGEVEGVICLRRSNRPFTTEDEIVLGEIAVAAAAALHGMEASSRDQQRVRELENLQRAVDLVAHCADQQAALLAIVESLASTFGYQLVSVYLAEGSELVLHSDIGYDAAPARVPVDHGVMGLVMAEGQPVLAEDVTRVPSLSGQPGIGSAIAVPIRLDGEVAGVLNVESGRERKLGQWDLTLIQLFSQQATVAMTNLTRIDTTSRQALIDSVTGLPNQGAFTRYLQHELDDARRHLQPLALLFLDLDNFKMANDAFGHRFGDELLAWLGEFLPRALPQQAWTARYGGEEFVVVLPRTAAETAEAIAEQLRAAMDERAFDTSVGHKVRMSVSIGIAAFDPDSTDIMTADQLVDAADRAMYVAKVRGRNRVVQWTPSVAEFLQSRP